MVEIEIKTKKQANGSYLTDNELKETFTMIKKSHDVEKICGREDWKFTLDTLKSWCSIENNIPKDKLNTRGRKKEMVRGVHAAALAKLKLNKTDNGQIIGFCTLSNAEANFPRSRDVEVCHMIIDKSYRRRFNGAKMVTTILEEALNLNFDKIYGRVFHGNEVAKSFINHLNWSSSDVEYDKDCQWYVFESNKEKISSIISDRMNELDRLTITNLSDLLGVSKQYINSLRNPLIGQPTKLPSPEVLHRLVLILSQKNTNLFHSFLKEKKDGKDWKHLEQFLFNSIKDKRYDTLYQNVDFSVVAKILLSFSQLQDLESGFVFSDNKIEFNERELINEEFKGKSKSQFNSEYEIWTISDIIAEQISMEFSRETVSNILNFGITYRFFVPITDQSNWELALKNILKVYKEMVSSKSYEDEWSEKMNHDKKHLSQHLHIYGVPDSMLFLKMRIYNALSPDLKGNINIGGITQESFKFIEIPKDTRDRISSVIKKLFISEEIIESNEFTVKDYALKVEKKYPVIN
ncbi:MAG: GNAT family N-acetyltransferase [Chitinophagales bacterium]